MLSGKFSADELFSGHADEEPETPFDYGFWAGVRRLLGTFISRQDYEPALWSAISTKSIHSHSTEFQMSVTRLKQNAECSFQRLSYQDTIKLLEFLRDPTIPDILHCAIEQKCWSIAAYLVDSVLSDEIPIKPHDGLLHRLANNRKNSNNVGTAAQATEANRADGATYNKTGLDAEINDADGSGNVGNRGNSATISMPSTAKIPGTSNVSNTSNFAIQAHYSGWTLAEFTDLLAQKVAPIALNVIWKYSFGNEGTLLNQLVQANEVQAVFRAVATIPHDYETILWCCICLKQQGHDSEEFKQYATSHLLPAANRRLSEINQSSDQLTNHDIVQIVNFLCLNEEFDFLQWAIEEQFWSIAAYAVTTFLSNKPLPKPTKRPASLLSSLNPRQKPFTPISTPATTNQAPDLAVSASAAITLPTDPSKHSRASFTKLLQNCADEESTKNLLKLEFIDQKTKNQCSLLMQAVQANELEAVQANLDLIDNAKDLIYTLTQQDDDAHTPLTRAIADGKIQLAKLILDCCLRIDNSASCIEGADAKTDKAEQIGQLEQFTPFTTGRGGLLKKILLYINNSCNLLMRAVHAGQTESAGKAEQIGRLEQFTPFTTGRGGLLKKILLYVNNSYNLLMCAVHAGQTESTELICDYASRLSDDYKTLKTLLLGSNNPYQSSPIELAISTQNHRLLELLLERCVTMPDQYATLQAALTYQSHTDGFNPLLRAIELGNLDAVKILIKKSESPVGGTVSQLYLEQLICINQKAGWTPLGLAIAKQQESITEYLLKQPLLHTDRRQMLTTINPSDGNSPLLCAIKLRSSALAQLIVNHISDLKQLKIMLSQVTAKKRRSSLDIAISQRDYPLLDLLLQQFARLDDQFETLKNMLQYRKNENGYTPLFRAFKIKDLKVINMLLTKGVVPYCSCHCHNADDGHGDCHCQHDQPCQTQAAHKHDERNHQNEHSYADECRHEQEHGQHYQLEHTCKDGYKAKHNQADACHLSSESLHANHNDSDCNDDDAHCCHHDCNHIHQVIERNSDFFCDVLSSANAKEWRVMLEFATFNKSVHLAQFLFKQLTKLQSARNITSILNHRDEDSGFTMLQYAIDLGNFELVKTILMAYGASRNNQSQLLREVLTRPIDDRKRLPLDLAIFHLQPDEIDQQIAQQTEQCNVLRKELRETEDLLSNLMAIEDTDELLKRAETISLNADQTHFVQQKITESRQQRINADKAVINRAKKQLKAKKSELKTVKDAFNTVIAQNISNLCAQIKRITQQNMELSAPKKARYEIVNLIIELAASIQDQNETLIKIATHENQEDGFTPLLRAIASKNLIAVRALINKIAECTLIGLNGREFAQMKYTLSVDGNIAEYNLANGGAKDANGTEKNVTSNTSEDKADERKCETSGDVGGQTNGRRRSSSVRLPVLAKLSELLPDRLKFLAPTGLDESEENKLGNNDDDSDESKTPLEMLLTYASKKIKWTPLELAICDHQQEITRTILHYLTTHTTLNCFKAVMLRKSEHYGWTPLFYAIDSQQSELVKAMLAPANLLNEQNGVLKALLMQECTISEQQAKTLDFVGAPAGNYTPLALAITINSSEIVQILLNKALELCANRTQDTLLKQILLQPCNGRSPLQIARLMQNDQITGRLLSAYALLEGSDQALDPDSCPIKKELGETSIMQELFSGKTQVAITLLQHLGRIDRAYLKKILTERDYWGLDDEDGESCSRTSSSQAPNSQLSLLRALSVQEQWTPLELAVHKNEVKFVAFAIKQIAALNDQLISFREVMVSKHPSHHWTLLGRAIEHNNPELINALLMPLLEFSAAELAASGGLEILEEILTQKSEITLQKQKIICTPLAQAIATQKPELVQALLAIFTPELLMLGGDQILHKLLTQESEMVIQQTAIKCAPLAISLSLKNIAITEILLQHCRAVSKITNHDRHEHDGLIAMLTQVSDGRTTLEWMANTNHSILAQRTLTLLAPPVSPATRQAVFGATKDRKALLDFAIVNRYFVAAMAIFNFLAETDHLLLNESIKASSVINRWLRCPQDDQGYSTPDRTACRKLRARFNQWLGESQKSERQRQFEYLTSLYSDSEMTKIAQRIFTEQMQKAQEKAYELALAAALKQPVHDRVARELAQFINFCQSEETETTSATEDAAGEEAEAVRFNPTI